VIIQLIFLFVLIVICSLTDILCGKIYNFITFPMIISGFCLNFYLYGYKGLLFAFCGFIIAGGIFIVLYLWGGFGAGDVKLMMAIGAIIGVNYIFDIILYSSIAGGIISIIVIIYKKQFITTLKNIFHFFVFLIPKYHLKSVPLKKENSFSIPYGFAIGIGTSFFIFLTLINT